LSIFRKPVEKIQFVSYLTRETDTLHEDVFTFVTYSLILFRMRNVSDRSCRENKNTFYVKFFFFEIPANYEIMWKNFVELDWPHMTIWGTRIACWIPIATSTH